ncbi:MAG: beta-glucosidase [Croceitalea sp.]|nr:beta-glucosidase [Croceitalea sp.]
MKKSVKIVLKVLGVQLLLVIIGALIGYFYFKSTFFTFEKEYDENRDIIELTIQGHTFFDLNANGSLDIYEDERAAISDRVHNLLELMTLEEKIHLLKGSGIASAAGMNEPGEGIAGAVGTIVPTPRLGIPTVYLSDGPAGLRIAPKREGEERTYYATAFPIATLLASTWNTAVVHEVGRAMGKEAMEYGIDVILGPGMNIHRHPLCGRNFEYFSEDPILSGYMGAAIVNGIESQGVGTSVKHFVANNQETDRTLNDVIVSNRALREIYLKGFEIVVRDAQPWTIMTSYNKVNGTYVTQDAFLLTQVLRDEWGFEGLVMSDWFGGKDAVAQVSAGNDLLEPGTKKQWETLTEAAEEGTLTNEVIDRAAGRILTLVFKSGKFKQPTFNNDPDLKEHAQITRQSASEGLVLLKNEGALPLAKNNNVALLGVTSYDFIAGGTGSGDVNEAYTVSLEQGLQNVGFNINQTAKDIYDKHKSANQEAFIKPEGITAMFNPYDPPEMSFTAAELTSIAQSADVGIFTIGRNAGEGGDRVEVDDFLLTNVEQQILSDASMAFKRENKKLIVVLNIGGVIETASWKAQPDAILLAWQGGQEGGNSVADILSGQVNPSGKLPITFPNALVDHASHTNFPLDGEQMSLGGIIKDMMLGSKEKKEADKVKNKDFTYYDEGIYVGYRHFDKAQMEVSYPFGFGLSYTDFEFGDLDVTQENDTINLALTVKNIGALAGKEVVQVYVSKPNTQIDRPVQELKAFAKTKTLQPDEEETIKFAIPKADLAYWNEANSTWTVEEGMYQIKVGNSSRNMLQMTEITYGKGEE